MKKALFKEIPFDQHTPITAYYALGGKGSCILESSPNKDRYSFIGIDPIASISGNGDYVAALREFKRSYPIDADHPLALYTGGCIGYITYDEDYFFQIYRSAITFDHHLGKAVLSTIGDEEELGLLYRKLQENRPIPEIEFTMGKIATDRSDEDYIAIAKRAKDHLQAGDVFQLVLSRTFQSDIQGDPLAVYRLLRQGSPSPYLFFFDLEQFAIAGASPEKLISVQDRIIESMPIAGTSPKDCPACDLLNDPKEVAEHIMLVDLARNDVGKVSIPGSVRVADFKTVHQFAHVNHIISKIVGTLDPQYDALDAFKASFPAGTLTGAPKIRAMELIEEIENSKRGLYGGAIVAIDTKGNLTSCIAIRTAIVKDGKLSVKAGAGIVLDSDPMKEARETQIKANTIFAALGGKNL